MEQQPEHVDGSAPHKLQWPGGRYIVGLDGSDSSIEALRYAIRLATVTGAQLEAVVAWDYPINNGPGWITTEWGPERDAHHILRSAVAVVLGTEIPPFITLVVRNGNTAAALIDQSRDADLLVVGSRGLGGFAGLLMGSVSQTCAEHAACPVLVVRAPQPAPSAST
jgi:nucleotide-binding universal stress UspA family protein